MVRAAPLVLAIAALAGSAAAYNAHVLGLVPRATATTTASPTDAGVSDACMSDALSIADSAPTAPADLISAIVKYAAKATGTATVDVCGWTTAIPSSLKPELSSWMSDVKTWASDHSADLSKLRSECPAATGAASICTGQADDNGGEATATGMATATGAAGAAGSDGTSGSTPVGKPNAAAGAGVGGDVVIMVGAMAGLMGAVAVLL